MSRYYISTGEKNCFYTLRYEFEEQRQRYIPGQQSEVYTVTLDYHVQNLSIDKATAIEKAKAICGLEIGADFTVEKIAPKREIDWSVFQSGKYAGHSIHEVREIDPDYLCWVCENVPNSRGYEKTVELARSLVAHKLAERAQARQEAADAQSAKERAIAAILKPLAANLRDGKGGFCDSVAADMESGHIPSGRALEITIDILGKRFGRRNSNAYWAGRESVSQEFEKAQLISAPQVILSHVG